MQNEELTIDNVVLPAKRQDEPTLKERMNENAYENIMPARYQARDDEGEVIEAQEDVFERVAKNIALGEVPHLVNNEGTVDFYVYEEHLKDDLSISDREVPIAEDVGYAPLSERTIKYTSYDNLVPDLPDSVREQVEEVKDEFQDLMGNLAFIPNTPTLINAGSELQQLSACFVNSPDDDMDDIHDTAREAAKVFQSGGGMGYAFSALRPYGDKVGSTGGIASGPITFMRTYDQMCKTIAQGGTRRGAQMGVMKISHPDVIEFIHAKNKDVSLAVALGLNDPKDPTNNSFSEALEEARGLIEDDGKVPKHLRNAVEGHLSNFNISVGVTHEFMGALYQGDQFTFTNPRTGEPHIATEETKEMWSRYGLGQYVVVGEELSVPAEEVWGRIIEGAYENGEPGVIYLDTVNDKHSFDIAEHPEHEIVATNPCGEQPLEEYEACNLGHINLSTIVADDAPDWREYEDEDLTLEEEVAEFLEMSIRWEEFDRRIISGTRFLDNVVTMSNFPVPEIEEKVTSMRKIGLGIMGYAQMLIQMGVPYGSEAGNEVARQVMKHINSTSKSMSHRLAVERGPFDEYEKSKYANPTEYPVWFEEHVGQRPGAWKDGYPVRNHNTTTIAPTGTTSMLGNTSGGCEPIYNVAFLKNVSQDIQGEEELVEFDDYFLRVLRANDVDVDEVKKEAVKKMQDPAEEFEGASSLDSVPDSIASVFITSGELSGLEHAKVQCAFQEAVDSAISKTVNFPSTATRADVRDVYEYIYNNDGKGVTVYVDGSREKAVLSTASNSADAEDGEPEEPETIESDASQEPPRPRDRPEVLDSTVYPIRTGYGDVNVFVNEDNDGEPFEVFAEIGKSGGYTHSFTEAVGRLTSLALRSGIPVDEVISQLDGIRSPKTGWHKNGIQIQSIPDAIAYALQEHTGINPDTDQDDGSATTAALENGETPDCPGCGLMTLNYSEGCKTCESCGWSEC